MRREAHFRVVKSIILKRMVCSSLLSITCRRITTQSKMRQIRKHPQAMQWIVEHQKDLIKEQVLEHPLLRWNPGRLIITLQQQLLLFHKKKLINIQRYVVHSCDYPR